jgi:hypothetical protein
MTFYSNFDFHFTRLRFSALFDNGSTAELEPQGGGEMGARISVADCGNATEIADGEKPILSHPRPVLPFPRPATPIRAALSRQSETAEYAN